MKELLASPGFLVSAGTMGGDVSYLLALVFTGLFLFAWRYAKKSEGTKHHNLVMISMVSMIVYFCAYYYARQLGVLSLEGKEGFGGPQEIYDNVFIPILTFHLILVTLGLIIAPYMIVQGTRACEKINGEFSLKSGDQKMKPETFKKVMLTILGVWLVNQVFQSAVRNISMASSIAWALIFLTIALVVSLEKFIEKMWPEGARRHRILGRAAMVIYALTLISSTMTYLMLYVIYPKV
ncbi:MAG: DUF420 domain-containing protein [Candidatus Nitrohelix vancouverensis]|uniref:DUF420 domain-containing protein n=1 Tax=Candidatus Nitrohelix vancouverensis TaxID=2705534 RepID=A0A7T0G4G1_9BACT|nr:MAG: DUF420 domain-containing protein [Candidatus Nitrohelix vancouverensis]